MQYGVSGAPVRDDLRYADVINGVGDATGFFPCVMYAVAWRESISGEANGLWPNASTVQSSDGGWGLFQLTSFHPENWQDPRVNATAAVHGWLAPDLNHFATVHGLTGTDLVQATADAFNRGRAAVCTSLNSHASPDLGSANGNYGGSVVRSYLHLILGEAPEGGAAAPVAHSQVANRNASSGLANDAPRVGVTA